MAGGGDEIMKSSSLLRFVLAATLIALTAILLYARPGEVVPRDAACTAGSDALGARNGTDVQRLPLSCFPAQIANWDSTEIVQDQDTLDKLGPGDFKERVYQDPAGKLPPIDLFIAYFPTQRTGDVIHSPQNCLPGSGWSPDENVRVTLSMPGHAPFPVNRYILSKA